MEDKINIKDIYHHHSLSPLCCRLLEALRFTSKQMEKSQKILEPLCSDDTWLDTRRDDEYLIFHLLANWLSFDIRDEMYSAFEQSPFYCLVTARRFFDFLWRGTQALFMLIIGSAALLTIGTALIILSRLSDWAFPYTATGKALIGLFEQQTKRADDNTKPYLSGDKPSNPLLTDPLLTPWSLSLAVDVSRRYKVRSSRATRDRSIAKAPFFNPEKILALVEGNPSALSARVMIVSLEPPKSYIRDSIFQLEIQDDPITDKRIAFLSPFEYLCLKLVVEEKNQDEPETEDLEFLIQSLLKQYPQHCKLSLASYWALLDLNIDCADNLAKDARSSSGMSQESKSILDAFDYISQVAATLDSWYTSVIDGLLSCLAVSPDDGTSRDGDCDRDDGTYSDYSMSSDQPAMVLSGSWNDSSIDPSSQELQNPVRNSRSPLGDKYY